MKLWWLAINGSSCAACFAPFTKEELDVRPRPEYLVGYATRKQQLARQQFFLTAPIEEVRSYLHGLLVTKTMPPPMAVKVTNPEPQTDGPTLWANFPTE